MRPIASIVQDMKASGMKTDAITTAFVANYELGIANQHFFYAMVRGDELREGHVAHASTEFADGLMQLRVLAEIFGLDWGTLITMGEEKLYERIAEFNNKERPRPDVELSKGTALAMPRSRSAYSGIPIPDGPMAKHYKHGGD